MRTCNAEKIIARPTAVRLPVAVSYRVVFACTCPLASVHVHTWKYYSDSCAALHLRACILAACLVFLCCAPVIWRARASVTGASAVVAAKNALVHLVEFGAPPGSPLVPCEARILQKRPRERRWRGAGCGQVGACQGVGKERGEGRGDVRGVGASDRMQAEHAGRAEDACKNERCGRGRLPVGAAGSCGQSGRPRGSVRKAGAHPAGRNVQCLACSGSGCASQKKAKQAEERARSGRGAGEERAESGRKRANQCESGREVGEDVGVGCGCWLPAKSVCQP